MADQRGAVAFETLIVYLFMVIFLLLPLADVATAGLRFIAAWEALRAFGQYVQFPSGKTFPSNTLPFDPTNSATWPSGQTVSGYTISNIHVMCGDANTACTSGNVALVPKYYSYSTTVALAPIGPTWLTQALCPSSCTYTLAYSERFQ